MRTRKGFLTGLPTRTKSSSDDASEARGEAMSYNKCLWRRACEFFLGSADHRSNKRISRGSSSAGLCVALVMASVVLLGPSVAVGKELSNKELGRLLLIRGLDREIAVAKVVLPRGKNGLVVNDKGEIDEAQAKEQLRQYGPAIQPGLPVEITKITFKPHRVIFQINNGGKRHKKWYQHIEIGMGGMMTPVDQQDNQNPIAFGSSVTLTFPQKSPDLSVEHAKKLLSSVLDFHRKLPTKLYSPNVPEKFKKAIKNHQVLVGMNRDEVLSAKGVPFRKVGETKPNGEETEDWLYGLPPHVLFVTFSGDTVIRVHQY